MTTLPDKIELVKRYLRSQSMFVEDEWISGCVEYLTEDTNHTETELQHLAKEQFLLNDLKEICLGCLPRDLKGQRKTTLNGRFVLQINAAIDIGTPAYQQYLKLQKVNTENVDATTKYEDKVPSHRMIKLYLTDGVQDISAIEYKPMRNLNCDITPGCKVLIKGPVECRRGVILMTEPTIELLGGEVQEIIISNSLAGMLSTKLGVTITYGSNNAPSIPPPRNTNIPQPHAQTYPQSAETQIELSKPVARVTSLQLADNNVNDDDIDFDQIAAIEAQCSNKRPSEEFSPPPEKKLKVATNAINDAEDFPNDEDMFYEEDEDYIKEMEAKFDSMINDKPIVLEKFPLKVNPEPYVFIKQINDMGDLDKAGKVFKVKGQILKLLSKLSVSKDGWSLKCTIVDGTGCLDVEFTSDVLSELVGLTPSEMSQLKRQMATKPELKEKAVQALQKAKNELQILNCIIEVTLLETPKITKLIPFEGPHVDSLQRRLKDTGL